VSGAPVGIIDTVRIPAIDTVGSRHLLSAIRRRNGLRARAILLAGTAIELVPRNTLQRQEVQAPLSGDMAIRHREA
jgi:hypothetical protein